ncbi:ABC transporter substrate-binding protein [Geodermatophilus ruber]|uniref:NitT/TauT family transport system substrate-binding protein n=1 Tax=Geodermatophilus ruber TaxID=504800 RepID=A0A1I4DEZ7_9ACTN|nr:ABC transporter substrate-binding protein [Geodermatophilus ruber]SFK91489.1 NitT/TauT family transport system substrate-binding protein [Geodermatophilus ruber]
MTFRPIRGLALSALVVTLVAACGSGDPEGSSAPPAEPGAPEVTDLTVGVLPLADLAPLYLAIEEGYFEDEGITVEPAVASGGAAQIAGMIAGDIDLTYSNYVSIVEAAEQGLPLRIVRENNRSGPQGIYAAADSGITRPADLAGQRIAINSLGNIQELTARAVLDSHGVDPDSLEFVELPPSDMPAALAEGAVDAAWLVEPFLTLVEQRGEAARIVSAFEGPTEDLPVAGWTATQQFVEQNPNTVAAFVRAMDQAMQLAADEPERLAGIIPTYTELSPELAGQLSTPGLAVTSDLSDLGTLTDLMVEHGVIEESPELDGLVVEADELPQE